MLDSSCAPVMVCALHAEEKCAEKATRSVSFLDQDVKYIAILVGMANKIVSV